MPHSPQSRYRLYTQRNLYFQIIKSTLLGTRNKGTALAQLVSVLQNQYGTEYVLPMPSARYGIYHAIKHTIDPGQEVILSPLTIVDVINMVRCAGGIPVFTDTDVDTCNISANNIEALITPNTGAILVTHLHGLSCDMELISKISEKHKIPLIEDCAQAFSTQYKNKRVGTFGQSAVLSFGAYKPVTSLFGGALLTKDPKVYRKTLDELEQQSWFQHKRYLQKFLTVFMTDIATAPFIFENLTYRIFRYAHFHQLSFINNLATTEQHAMAYTTIPDQYRCRMTQMQARLVLSQLEHVKRNDDERVKRAQIYHDGLRDIAEISLPPMRLDGSHTYTYYPIQVPDRDKLIHFAFEKRRDWVRCHYRNCADLTCFKPYRRECPVSRKTTNTLIYLPTYPRYALSEVYKNIETVREFFG